MSTPQMQRTVPELLGNIVDNIQQIIRSEFRLAKAELLKRRQDPKSPLPRWEQDSCLDCTALVSCCWQQYTHYR